MDRQFILFGVLLALLHVVLSAFGAHWLQADWSADQRRWFDLAGDYQLTHALALILCGLANRTLANRTLANRTPANRTLANQTLASHTLATHTLGPSRLFNRACLLLLAGTVLFSGSLYLMVFTGIKSLGAITPLGGVALILGWAFFALAVYRSEN